MDPTAPTTPTAEDRSRVELVSVRSWKGLLEESRQAVGIRGKAPGRVRVEKAPEAAGEAGDLAIRFTISTPDVDRDGDTVAQDGWDLEDFHRFTGPVLFGHDYGSLPVATAPAELTRVVGKGDEAELESVAIFTPRDLYPFGDMVGRMVEAGFLKGASPGFLPLEWTTVEDRSGPWWEPTHFVRQKLLEWSVVPVPSGAFAGALKAARAGGLEVAPAIEWAEKILDGEARVVVPRAEVEAAWKAAAPDVRRILAKGIPSLAKAVEPVDEGASPPPADPPPPVEEPGASPEESSSTGSTADGAEVPADSAASGPPEGDGSGSGRADPEGKGAAAEAEDLGAFFKGWADELRQAHEQEIIAETLKGWAAEHRAGKAPHRAAGAAEGGA